MHERDARLTFDAAEHAYWWDGKRVSMSVTGVWESYFPSFDSDATIQKFFGSWLSNPNSKYAALCRYLALVEGADEARQKQAIAALWEANRTKAAALGTRLHAAIETHLLTGQSPDTADTMPELAHYLQWRDDVASDWEPIKVEWKIYDERADVAGTIDSLWTDQTGKLVLVDWKRAKKGALEQKAYRNETGWGPCAALANNAMGHYTVCALTHSPPLPSPPFSSPLPPRAGSAKSVRAHLGSLLRPGRRPDLFGSTPSRPDQVPVGPGANDARAGRGDAAQTRGAAGRREAAADIEARTTVEGEKTQRQRLILALHRKHTRRKGTHTPDHGAPHRRKNPPNWPRGPRKTPLTLSRHG